MIRGLKGQMVGDMHNCNLQSDNVGVVGEHMHQSYRSASRAQRVLRRVTVVVLGLSKWPNDRKRLSTRIVSEGRASGMRMQQVIGESTMFMFSAGKGIDFSSSLANPPPTAPFLHCTQFRALQRGRY